MRRLLPLLALSTLAGCGGVPSDQETSTRDSNSNASADVNMDASSDAAAGAPGLSVTAAPGVAFDYRYAFRLPSARIAAVQEQHAQACERLGLARCRITGAKYRVVGEREIEAMLAFKVDPTVARAFGKTGVEAVDNAEGMLVDAEITGTDAGSAIKAASRGEAELTEELRTLEQQLARAGLPGHERARLQMDAQSLREQLRGIRAGRTAQQESVATTPMAFHYGSGELIPGFDTRGPIRAALARAGENFVAGVSTLIVLLITILPWAGLAFGGWWLITLLRTRFAWLLPTRPAEA
ncbi:MAG TPA: hypothetical protein VF631_04215 [Allosphingosinicella sp.]|jgi:uncharacterized protein YceK|uniref:hypothetical protein n=1 Tax=Allosphingosinicella sp. TaxID=2823234 RepID=UPI002F2891FB